MIWQFFRSTTWIFILFQFKSSQTLASQRTIPGSTLKADICYTIDMKGFTPGYLTWFAKNDTKFRKTKWFLNHEYRLGESSLAKFQKGGEWHENALWKFHASNSYPDWYKLLNCHFPDKFVTWSWDDIVPTQRFNTSHYVTLERDRKEEDYLLKPVFAEKNDRIEYHQLTMRRFPHGKINWSRHTKTSHFIQNHHGTSKKDWMERYEREGTLFDDTLFIFKEVDEDGVCLAGSSKSVSIEHFPMLHQLIVVSLFSLKMFI